MKTLTKNQWIGVTVALVAGFFFIYGDFVSTFFTGNSGVRQSSNSQSEPVIRNETQDGGLIIQDVSVGIGAEAKTGSEVTVNYVGTLENGTKFDSSYDRGTPYPFTLGARQVILGWEEGILGMKVGGKRRLVIPPNLAYGSQVYGPIPANSTLIFDVELLDVK